MTPEEVLEKLEEWVTECQTVDSISSPSHSSVEASDESMETPRLSVAQERQKTEVIGRIERVAKSAIKMIGRERDSGLKLGQLDKFQTMYGLFYLLGYAYRDAYKKNPTLEMPVVMAFEKMLEIHRWLYGDKIHTVVLNQPLQGEASIEIARVYNTLGMLYVYSKKAQDMEKALEYVSKAQKLYESDHKNECDYCVVFDNLAIIYEMLGKASLATAFSGKSAIIRQKQEREKEAEITANNKEKLAFTIKGLESCIDYLLSPENKGKLLSKVQLSELETSIRAWEIACLETLKKTLNMAWKKEAIVDPLFYPLVDRLKALGMILKEDQCEFFYAKKIFQLLLTIYQQRFPEDKLKIIEIENNLGEVSYTLGRLLDAEHHFDSACELYDEHNAENLNAQHVPERIRISNNQRKITHAKDIQGENIEKQYFDVISTMNVLIKTDGEINEKVKKEYEHRMAETYYYLGCLSRDADLWDKAEMEYGKAMKICIENIYQGKLPNDPNIARLMFNWGWVKYKKDPRFFAEALDDHGNALMIYRELKMQEGKFYHHPDAAHLFENLGAMYYDQHQYRDAIIHYERAYFIREKIRQQSLKDVQDKKFRDEQRLMPNDPRLKDHEPSIHSAVIYNLTQQFFLYGDMNDGEKTRRIFSKLVAVYKNVHSDFNTIIDKTLGSEKISVYEKERFKQLIKILKKEFTRNLESANRQGYFCIEKLTNSIIKMNELHEVLYGENAYDISNIRMAFGNVFHVEELSSVEIKLQEFKLPMMEDIQALKEEFMQLSQPKQSFDAFDEDQMGCEVKPHRRMQLYYFLYEQDFQNIEEILQAVAKWQLPPLEENSKTSSQDSTGKVTKTTRSSWYNNSRWSQSSWRTSFRANSNSNSKPNSNTHSPQRPNNSNSNSNSNMDIPKDLNLFHLKNI